MTNVDILHNFVYLSVVSIENDLQILSTTATLLRILNLQNTQSSLKWFLKNCAKQLV